MIPSQKIKGCTVALVNFYDKPPSAAQVASDLNNNELVVFQDMTTSAADLQSHVAALINFGFNMHNENTIPKWDGEDYFVMLPQTIDNQTIRDKLRPIAMQWCNSGSPKQIKHI